MKKNFLIQDVLTYRFSWAMIFLPAIISFFIVGPLGEIPEYFKYGHEVGYILASLFLSISAAGLFHFFIVFRPEREKARATFKLIEQHFFFIDRVITELIQIIDPSIDNLSQLEKNLESFLDWVKDFEFTKRVIWNSKVIRIQIGPYNKLLYSALGRFDNIKDAMIFNPNEFDASDFEKISDLIFHRDIIYKKKLENETYQRCYLAILEFYPKLTLNVREKINNF